MDQNTSSFLKLQINRYGLPGEGVHFEGYALRQEQGHNQPDVPLRAVGPRYQGASLYEAVAGIPAFNGPVVISGGLEAEPDPWGVVRAVADRLQGDAYLIIESQFTPPDNAADKDRWRFTPTGLIQLALNAQLLVLDSGWVSTVTEQARSQGQGGAVGERCFVVAARHALVPQEVDAAQRLTEENGVARVAHTPTKSPFDPQVQHARVVILHTFYDKFLFSHYQSNPGLEGASYQAQLAALHETGFGDCDFYSRGLREAGCTADDIVVNCAPLQRAWAREHGISCDGWQLVDAQLRQLAPQVVYVQDMAAVPQQLLVAARERGALIVGQVACELARTIPLDSYDVVFSSFPHFVEAFRGAGVTSYYQPLAFDRRVLDGVISRPYQARDIGVSFVGGISSFHSQGTALLEQLARHTDIQIWGYGAEHLPVGSASASRHRGEAWGRGMFDLLMRSRITINRHSEAAAQYANNMRLFEATGAGALLITDYKENLRDLFEVDKEVVTYRSVEECIEKIRYYQAHPNEAGAIAAAGQRRTLCDHSYEQRMRKSAEILNRHVLYRTVQGSYTAPTGVSQGYSDITSGDVTDDLVTGLKEPSIAHIQRGLVQEALTSMYAGNPGVPFKLAAELMAPLLPNAGSVLEIGCSSGYYYEALEYLLNRNIEFTGCDYSEAMIEMAQYFYPRARFDVADGARLPYAEHSFDFVISGCVLPYCPNYRDHIRETCRVARDHVLLHRTSISSSGQERLLRKYAYGVPTVEIWFAETTLLGLFAQHGFECQKRVEYHRDAAAGVATVTYLLARQR